MEHEFVAWLERTIPRSERLRVGIGDDAAVVGLDGSDLVATSDLLIDGVHFLSAEHTPERIGRKALAVNLSDLAAMAARPVGALVSLATPREGVAGFAADEAARRLLEGMAPLAERFGCPIIGGDTNVGPGPLVVSVTAFGEPTQHGVALRSGARPGDALYVTGQLGGSLAGRHLDFTPRVDEALALHAAGGVHAMMDLSDGLSTDLDRMCRASGVGAVVDAAALPVCGSVAADDPIAAALNDGEDFELLFALGPDAESGLPLEELECGVTRIGRVVEGAGVWLDRGDGPPTPMTPAGYEHR